jgi:hypothetical protein
MGLGVQDCKKCFLIVVAASSTILSKFDMKMLWSLLTLVPARDHIEPIQNLTNAMPNSFSCALFVSDDNQASIELNRLGQTTHRGGWHDIQRNVLNNVMHSHVLIHRLK